MTTEGIGKQNIEPIGNQNGIKGRERSKSLAKLESFIKKIFSSKKRETPFRNFILNRRISIISKHRAASAPPKVETFTRKTTLSEYKPIGAIQKRRAETEQIPSQSNYKPLPSMNRQKDLTSQEDQHYIQLPLADSEKILYSETKNAVEEINYSEIPSTNSENQNYNTLNPSESPLPTRAPPSETKNLTDNKELADYIRSKYLNPKVAKTELGRGQAKVAYLDQIERRQYENLFSKATKPLKEGFKKLAIIEVHRQEAVPEEIENLRFYNELEGEGIPKLHGYLEVDGKYFIVSKFVNGGTLTDQITKGTIQGEAKDALFKQILEAGSKLDQAGVVHRDLWSDNVLLQEKEGSVKPFINDFGFASKVAEQQLIPGSLNVSAAPPELLEEREAAWNSTKYNSWQIGVIGLQLYTGLSLQDMPWKAHPAFSENSLYEQNNISQNKKLLSKVPEEIRPVIQALLSPNRETRATNSEALKIFNHNITQRTVAREENIQQSKKVSEVFQNAYSVLV